MSYNRVDAFSPLGDAGAAGQGTVYQSPLTYSQTWEQHHGDLGTPDIEMNEHPPRPGVPTHRASANSLHSTTSTLFPSNAIPGEPNNESQSFLNDPINKIDHTYTMNNYVPYKDHTGRQLRHLLVGSSTRFFITAALCTGYVVSAKLWHDKGVQSEGQKRIYNTLTTGISIALSLNIASSFKDMALNMRWPILSSRKRNLEETDLILHADSMMELSRLALTSKRSVVVLACVSWLFINILAQAGVAMLSLTYSWDTDYTAVLKSSRPGNVTISKMDHFYPSIDGNNNIITIQDEEYTAHLYGGLAFDIGVDSIVNMPQPGDIYNFSAAAFYQDYSESKLVYQFLNSPAGTSIGFDTFSMYTERTINMTYTCESHKVTANGNGTFNEIEVANIGTVYVSHKVPNATSFFTNMPLIDGSDSIRDYNRCGNDRCTIVEAFEASNSDPWYYKCNITTGHTLNDQQNVSFISDDMAFKAGSSIAQIGYTDDSGQEVQIYPQGSPWGKPLHGNTTDMGMAIATFAIGAIGGADTYNPRTSFLGTVPSQGFILDMGHQKFFYSIIALIIFCHFLFASIAAVLANRVMVGPAGHLGMSLLLRPIADALEGVSGGRINSAYKDATKNTFTRYEKARNGRWVLAMT
ncbi:hypothetical protein LSUE1_G002086 [Lachnellula suecica]|uniref:Uncharacterized protein n=1 Tax=Lachnellula suecica TaxID=602035 RepID=A0A8T9CF25_9HELO|nr:hypothetical protein LSUE1_G002086 [Lachnellula suecica]